MRLIPFGSWRGGLGAFLLPWTIRDCLGRFDRCLDDPGPSWTINAASDQHATPTVADHLQVVPDNPESSETIVLNSPGSSGVGVPDGSRLSEWIEKEKISRSRAYELLKLLQVEPEARRVNGSRKPVSHITLEQDEYLKPFVQKLRDDGCSMNELREMVEAQASASALAPVPDSPGSFPVARQDGPGSSETVALDRSGLSENTAVAIVETIKEGLEGLAGAITANNESESSALATTAASFKAGLLAIANAIEARPQVDQQQPAPEPTPVERMKELKEAALLCSYGHAFTPEDTARMLGRTKRELNESRDGIEITPGFRIYRIKHSTGRKKTKDENKGKPDKPETFWRIEDLFPQPTAASQQPTQMGFIDRQSPAARMAGITESPASQQIIETTATDCTGSSIFSLSTIRP